MTYQPTHDDHQATLHLTCWGVRGSYPTPGPATVGIGGNTACIEIRANGHTIILDAGTGIIGLGRDLLRRAREHGGDIEATILFSHYHHDHTQGLPFFAPAYVPSTQLHIFGPGCYAEPAEDVLARNQAPTVFPVSFYDMRAEKNVQSLQDGDTILITHGMGSIVLPAGIDDYPGDLPPDAVMITTHRSYAHPGGTLMYRIEYAGQTVVYATDTEGYIGTDRRLVEFARGADLLIHDAQFTEEHYYGRDPRLSSTQGHGHSTPRMACEVAQAAGADRLVLFHHDPGYDDTTIRGMEEHARQVFPNVIAAYEGLHIELGHDERDRETAFGEPNQSFA
ncbi:MAG: MBL fold metallo-hydrolase [Anaerolineae bacterium]|nr:MBL fold metallo-hydrolase [Anaerolineae bacterium]